jgi:hypothetical protein
VAHPCAFARVDPGFSCHDFNMKTAGSTSIIRIGSLFESPSHSNANEMHLPGKPNYSFKLCHSSLLFHVKTERQRRRQIAQMSTRRHFSDKRCSGFFVALRSPPLANPLNKVFHLGAVLPGEAKKLLRIQRRGFRTEKRLEAPPYIRTVPGVQAIAAGDDPVIAQSFKHPLLL